MTRWENTSVYRALGTLSALPARALSRLPLREGKTRRGLSFSQWFLLLGTEAMLCVPHGAWNNLCAVLFALAALLVYWFDCATRKKTPWNAGNLGAAVLGFLLMTVLCTLWANNKAGNLRVALFFWTGFLLAYLAAAQFRRRDERRTAAAVLYVTLLAVSVYGLWNYLTGAEASDVPIDGEMYRRLGATLEHGINCGEFLAMALPIALVWALTAPTKARRIALTVPLLLPCAAILLTYARTGWIMLALALFLLLWYKKKILLLPAAALGIGALFLLPESVQARFLSMLDFSNASASGRFVLWGECLALWKDKWLSGIGLGPENFYAAYAPYATGLLDFQPPHSNMLYLEMFLSTGILGGVLFCGFFFGIFVRLRRAVRAKPEKRDRWEVQALTASLAGAALGGIPEYIWFYPRILFFWCALFGMAIAASGDNRTGQPADPAREPLDKP